MMDDLGRLGPIEAVSLDFTGTLAHVPRLGAIYAEALRRHGAAVDPDHLARLFREAWDELDCRVVLGQDRFRHHPGGAEGFWGSLLARILERLGAEPPSPFLAAELFDRFRRADAWKLWPDVVPALEELHERGIRVGIVSNFDHRLPGIVRDLDLEPLVTTVVTSWEVGAEKPHPLPFDTLRRRLQVHPRRLVHVGNDRRRDVEGAVAAGLRALWLSRDGDEGADLSSLAELGDRLRDLETTW
jgi:putative hydrolase of the HAD superfamily